MPILHGQDEGVLTIGGISMNPSNGAWAVIGNETGEGGLLKLWIESTQRGDDRILPNAPGVVPYARLNTVHRADLRLLVCGEVIGQTSAPASDSRIGIMTNLAYLKTNVIAPVVSASGTRAATLSMPSGSPLAADIHVLGLQVQSYMYTECGAILIGTLQISIPTGAFV